MRFQWEFGDFLWGYFLKVIVMWIAILSAFTCLAYLVTEFLLGEDLSREHWIIIWIAILVIGVFIAQAVVYYRIAQRQIPGDRIEKALKAVSDLREEAVVFRNEKLPEIHTKQGFLNFTKKYKEWHDKLIVEVDKISPSYAHLFRVLDKYKLIIPENWNEISNLDKEKLKAENQVSAYTERIYQFVSQFSRENLSNRVKK